MIKRRTKLSILALAVALVACFALVPAEDTEAVAPLNYTWSCVGGYCVFHAQSNYHQGFRWNFGDGSGLTPMSSSTTATHDYQLTDYNQHYYTVYLLGYATTSSSSPDNIIGCTIMTYRSPVGGDPGTNGSC